MQRKILIYPSRWYEHKNHHLLIEFAKNSREFLASHSLQFVTTIAESTSTRRLLQRAGDSKLGEVFVNIGEVTRVELFRWYAESYAIVFPSESETFGNGLLEGACFSLPILVADRPYGRAFGQENVITFEPRDFSSWRAAISHLIENYAVYAERSGRIAKENAIDSQTWINRVLDENAI
ncbi:glycosyltransferase [Lentisalinibacter orientalis]|uniref:glycosyltransferase n=1 Tax=Lentisalinibacter orientalis TaxID=2992241 RepID=UPI003864626D